MNVPPKNPPQSGQPAVNQTAAPGGVAPQQRMAPMGNRPANPGGPRPMQPNPNMRPGGPRPMQPNPNMRPMPRQGVPQNGTYARPNPSQQPTVTEAPVQQQPETPLQTQVQANAAAQTQEKSAIQAKPQKSRYEPNFASDFGLPPSVISTKGFLFIAIILLVIGIFVGNAMSGGGSSQSQQPVVGLRGVVANKDITAKMPRCGLTERGQACLLYIMNSTRYDRVAEDFFGDAVKLMGVQQYSIAMVNPKYAKERIPPGYFAEIKIPNVR